ncbi:MAG: H-NS histone family protein [Burkholderiales bacterium]|nr:H-NS histone family protein [Burkholderiales bacterium]MDE2564543.1 H-NS histone family protein [Burkholderiales bacterium]
MVKNALTDLIAQKAALEQQIAEMQREQRSEAIAQVKSLMSEYGLTLADIGQAPRASAPPRAVKAKVAAKYRDPATGNTWSGRGLKPKWLSAELAAGRQLADFAL